jgi:hypothetical protein
MSFSFYELFLRIINFYSVLKLFNQNFFQLLFRVKLYFIDISQKSISIMTSKQYKSLIFNKLFNYLVFYE